MALKREAAGHLGYIDSLRGIAVLGVIVIHCAMITQQTGRIFDLASTGQRGVQLFYVVSAFTLCLSLDNRRREHHLLGNFFLRRFFRIAPLFYVAIVANLLLSRWRPALSPIHGLGWPYTVLGFLFLHGASPKDIDAVVIGGWSVAVETTFYLLLPFLHRHFNTVRKTLLLFVLSALVCGLVSFGLADRSVDLVHEQYFAFLWFPVEFPVFVLGMMSYCLWKQYIRALQGSRELSLLLLFASFMIYWGCLPFSDHKLYPSSLVFLTLILALSIHPWPLLVNSFTRFLGKISYSIYLVHFFVVIFVNWLVERANQLDPYGGNKTVDAHVCLMYHPCMDVPTTLQKAIAHFSNPENAFQAAVEFRWSGGNVTCPRCGGAKHSFIKTRRIWFCYDCKKQFTVKVGTIFEDSPLGLDKWMIALWMLANCKNGISSYELAKVLGIRQNSAWFMLHRIREAMKDNPTFKFGGEDGGPVESDETFVGPNPHRMHKSRKAKIHARDGAKGGYIGKTAVFGVLDRDLRQVRAQVVPNVKRETLQNEILNQVHRGSKVYTDAAVGYDHLRKDFVHEVVNHAKEYVNGQVHTQGLDNFWSLLKRTLRGTYVAVEPFHLDHYLDEQVFRYNNRATKDNPLNDADRFALLMSQVAGKRLTYAQLTGKGTDSLHHPEAGTGQEEPF